MPLSKIQTAILRLLAAHRDPESYIAGASALNRDAPRYSSDIDVFHSREERAASAAADDAETLVAAGYALKWVRREPAIYTAEVAGPYGATRLEWVVDSEMPTEKMGLLFLEAGKVVQPDPERLDSYQAHAGQPRGHWPSSTEIAAAMLERYSKKPNGNEPKP